MDKERYVKLYEELLFPKNVFKYKSANAKNLKALLNNQLYVPRADCVNDVSEIALFVKEDNAKLFNKFIKLFQKGCYILSFGVENDNVVMWNTYSNSFGGYVIDYSIESLKEKIVVQHSAAGCRYGFVHYSDKKIPISPEVIQQYGKIHKSDVVIKFDSYKPMFTKSSSWSYKKEFRFVFGASDQDIDFINPNNSKIYKKGFMIEQIKPNKVILGYKMEDYYKRRIINYCNNNDIPIEIARPNLYSEKYEVVFEKNNT